MKITFKPHWTGFLGRTCVFKYPNRLCEELHTQVVLDSYLVDEGFKVNGSEDIDNESERAFAEPTITQCLSLVLILNICVD